MGGLQVAYLVTMAVALFGSAYMLLGLPIGAIRLSARLGIKDALGRLGSLGTQGRGASPRAVRQNVIRQMPTFLDIVTLGIASGLSFDSSLDLYCERYQTTLSSLVANAALSWRIGVRSRKDALEALARETGVPAMERFSATVSEALAFGTPLAGALSHQAQAIRDEQRAQIEEEIERVPVKMLIPLGTLIVPAMLLAILGPLLAPALGL